MALRQQTGRIGAIILTYNRKDLLAVCLDAVLRQSLPADEIILLDNGSTDGTRAALAAAGFLADARFRIYAVDANLGPAAGFDLLFRIAWKRPLGWYWFMDDDVIPEADALERLVEAYRENFAAPEELGFLQSLASGRDGSPSNMPEVDLRAPPDLCPSWADRLDRGLVKLRWATLNSLLVPRSTLARIGGLSADFRFAGEDIDFTLRTTQLLPGYLVGRSKVRHLRGFSGVFTALNQSDPTRIGMARYYYRNNIYLRLRYYSFPATLLFVVKCVLHAARALLAKDHRLLRAVSILCGMAAGLIFRPHYVPLEGEAPVAPSLLGMERDEAVSRI